MKQVIILESRGQVGGACQSLKLLIQNIGHSVDLIVPKGEEDYISKRMIKKFYGENVDKVFEFYLPLCLQNIKGGDIYDINTLQRNLRLFKKNKNELYDFLKKQNYEHIHLNGLGLYPVLTKKLPMTIHIRQVFDGNIVQKMIVSNYLLKAKGLIYIDPITKEPFKHLKANSVLISNPIDQTKVNTFDKKSVMESYGFKENEIIFVIAGTISEVKGHEFLIRVFKDFNEYPYKLLIAGDGEAELKRRCTELAKDNPNIVFMGKISHDQMLELYSITDYVIRAEAFFGFGRTVYEGLYSGTGLIIQGTKKELLDSKIYTKYRDRIYSYTPRDMDDLKAVLHKIDGKKVSHSKAISNAMYYGKLFNEYITKVLK